MDMVICLEWSWNFRRRGCGDAIRHKAAGHEFRGGLIQAVRFRRLSFDPLDKTRQARFQRDLRPELKAGANRLQIGIPVPDVAEAILSCDNGFGLRAPSFSEKKSDLCDRCRLPGADVQRRAVGGVRSEPQGYGPRHVGNMHEIAALLAILVKLDGLSRAQLVGEYRKNTCVRFLSDCPSP